MDELTVVEACFDGCRCYEFGNFGMFDLEMSNAQEGTIYALACTDHVKKK